MARGERSERVDSHSSLLTNQHIQVMRAKVAALGYEAMSNIFHREKSLQYWAAVSQLYNHASFLFQARATRRYLEEMERRLKSGFMLSFRLQGKHFKRAYPLEIAALNFHSYGLDGLITMAGQVLQYWTRISKQNPQGLREHLEMFNRMNPIGKEMELMAPPPAPAGKEISYG